MWGGLARKGLFCATHSKRMSERNLCNSIVEFLNYQGCWVWRTNSGALKANYTDRHGNTRSRMIRMSRAGTADIIGMTKRGRFVALEVKTPERKKNVTPAQLEFLQTVALHGGLSGVVTTHEEALAIIGVDDEPRIRFG